MDTLENNGMSKPEIAAGAAAADDTWTVPQHVHIPRPTCMPILMALGMMCMLWGIVTTPLITLLGAVLFMISIKGWIGELRHEHGHPDAG